MKKFILYIFLLFSVAAVAQPANDNCSGAISIGSLPTPAACPSGNGTTTSITGTTVGATAMVPYPYMIGCATGPAIQQNPANDVWYSFTTTGSILNINLASSMSTPVIAIWSGTCGNLAGVTCGQGTGGVLNMTTTNVNTGTTYLIQISGGTSSATGTFTLTLDNDLDCNNCLQTHTLTATPAPTAGTYAPGTTVTFCYTVSSYTQVSNNWLHGVAVTFGAGWDQSTLSYTMPGDCNGNPPGLGNGSGAWGWYNSVTQSISPFATYGPGWFFESFEDGDPANNPGNNYGDYTSGSCSWTFCLTITTSTVCASGTSLNMSFNSLADGESGSWVNVACTGDPSYNFNAVLSCCSSPSISSQTNVSCYGGSNGSATATPQGTTSPWDYVWTGASGTIQTANNVAGPNTVSGLAAGTYTVTVTDDLNCVSSQTITITQPAQTVLTPGSNTPVCTGQTINLTTNTVAGATYSWTGPNSFTSSAEDPTISNATSAMAGTYSVSVTVGGCTSATYTTAVTIVTTPTASPSSNTPVCAGTALNLSATTVTGGTYSWTGPNSFSSSSQNPTISPATTAASGTYSLTVTANGCTSAVATTAVTVNPLPVLSAVSSQTVCGGTTVSGVTFATTPAGGSISWSNNNTGTGLAASGTGNISSYTAPTVATTTSGTVTATPTLSGCAGSAGTFTITIAPTPTLSSVTSQTVCGGNAVSAINYSSSPSGATVNWSNNNTGTGIGASGSGNISSYTAPSVTVTTTGTVTATPSIGSCTGAPITFTVTIRPTPVLSAVSSQTVCGGTTVSAINYAVVPASSTINWSNNNTAIGLGASGTGNISSYTAPAVTSTTSGTVTATSSFSGCPGNSVTYTITISPTPTITASPDIVRCAGQTINAIAFVSNPVGATFNWSNNNTAVGLGASGSGNISSYTAPAVGSVTSATVTVTPAIGSCNGTADQFVITINPLPVINTSGIVITPASCGGSDGGISGISATGTPALTYSWNGGASSGTSVITGQPAGTYNLTVTDGNGCISTAGPFSIGNPSAPPAPAISSIPALCAGANFTLSISSPVGGVTYTWTGPSGALGTGTSITITGATTSNSGIYSATATQSGCTGPAGSTTVTVNPIPVITASSDITVCGGNTVSGVNFTSTPAGATFNWTNSNTGVGLGASGTGNIGSYTAPTVTVATTANISITPVLAGCSGTADVYVITINPTPVLSAVSSQTICGGTTVAATNFAVVPAASTINWSNSNTAIGLGASGTGNISSYTAPTVVNTETATVTVTSAAGACPGNSQTFTITINPTPVLSSVGSQTVCGGNPVAGITYNTTPTGSTINWTNNQTGIGLIGSGAGNIPGWTSPLVSSPTTGAITATPVITGCTGAPVTFTVTINPTPVLSGVASQTVCGGAAVNAINYGTSPSGATVTWNNTNTAVGVGSSGTGNIAGYTAPLVTSVQTGDFSVSSSLNGCPGNSTTFTITINPTPTLSSVSSQTVCAGSTVNGISFSTIPLSSNISWTNTQAAIGIATSGSGDINSWTAPVVPATTSGVVTATPDLNGCTGSAISFTVVIEPTPVLTPAADQTVCGGAAVSGINFNTNPSGAAFGWTNDNTNVGLGANGSGNISSYTAPALTVSDTGNVVVIPLIGNCVGVADTFIIIINPTPVISGVSNQTVCSGQMVNAINFSTTPSGVPVNWTNNNTNTGLAASGSGDIAQYTSPIVSTSQLSTITADASQSGCSAAPVSFDITINPLPQIDTTNMVVTPSACGGSTGSITGITVNGTPNFTYVWNGGNSASPDFNNIPAGPYVLVVTDGNGCSNIMGPVNIINPGAPPAPLVTGTPFVCAGNSDTLSIFNPNGSTTYDWYGPNGPLGSGTSIVITNITAFDTGFYFVTGTVNGCTGPAGAFLIGFNPNPAPAIAGVNTFCAGDSTILTASASGSNIASYEWLLNGSPVGNTPADSTITSTGGGNYSVVITDVFGCSDTSSVTVVTANALPVINATAVALTNTNCLTPTGAISGITAGGAPTLTYNWYDNGVLVSSSTTTPDISNVGNGLYSVIVVDGNGCTDTAGVFPISNIGAPPAPTASGAVYCSGQTLNALNASGTNGTFTWYGNAQLTNVVGNGTSYTPTNTVTDTVYVVETLSGCSSLPTAVIVTINSLPVVNAGNDVAVCDGNNVTLSGSGAVTYTWSGGVLNGASFTPVSSASYTVTGTDANGCVNTDVVNVTVNQLPLVSAGANQSACAGNQITLSGSGAATYVWSGGVNNGTPFSPASSTSYTVTGTDANGCSSTDTVSVTVNPNPVANAGVNDTLPCGNGTLMLNGSSSAANSTYQWSGPGIVSGATSSSPSINTPGVYTLIVTDVNTGCVSIAASVSIAGDSVVAAFTPDVSSGTAPLLVNFTNSSYGASTYTWAFGDGNSSTATNPANTFNTANSYTVVLIATSANGCTDTATSVIYVYDASSITVPNVFSPNADGTNDFFNFQSSGLAELTCTIFNRWGVLMITIDGVNASWDGNVNNSEPAADGTYFYLIKAKGIDGKEFNLSGYVLLTR